MSRKRAEKRTVEIKLNLSPQEFARLEELASFEGESPEGIIRLSLQYHWNGYQRALAEIKASMRKMAEIGARGRRPRPTSPDDDIPW